MPRNTNDITRGWLVYKELEKIAASDPKISDKDGWITNTPELRDRLRASLGMTRLQLATAINQLSRVPTTIGKSPINVLKDNRSILGIQLVYEPAKTVGEALKAATAVKIKNGTFIPPAKYKKPNIVKLPAANETKTNGDTETKPNGATLPEFVPETLSYSRAVVMTPELDQYADARKFAGEAVNSPYLRIEFTENALAEEALALKEALDRAETLLVERTKMLNVVSRERNYLKKIQNPTLRSALQSAGVMVKHGD